MIPEAATLADTRNWYDYYVRLPGDMVPRRGTDELNRRNSPRDFYGLAGLYRLADNTTGEVVKSPEVIHQITGIPVRTLERLVGRYPYADGKPSPWAPWVTFVREDRRHADEAEGGWTVRWVLRMAPVRDDDFIKVMFWWLWEQDSYDRIQVDGEPWDRDDPAILAAVAISRVGRDFRWTRDYGRHGLATFMGVSDSQMDKALRSAEKRGLITVAGDTGGERRPDRRGRKGGRGKHNRALRSVNLRPLHEPERAPQSVATSPQSVATSPQDVAASPQDVGASPQASASSPHRVATDTAPTFSTDVISTDSVNADDNPPTLRASHRRLSAGEPDTTDGKGGKSSSEEDSFDDLAAWLASAPRDEVDERLRAAIKEAGGREALSGAWWTVCVYANLLHGQDGFALTLSATDMAQKQPWLLARRQAYGALDLAKALMAMESPSARDHTRVLVYRLKNLAERPLEPVVTSDDAPWLQTSPAADPLDGAPKWIRDEHAARDAVPASDWHIDPWQVDHRDPENPAALRRWGPNGELITWDADLQTRLQTYVDKNPEAEPELRAWRESTVPQTGPRNSDMRAVDQQFPQHCYTEQW